MVAPLLSTNFKPTAVSMLQNRKGAMLGLYTGMYVVSSGLLVSWYSIIASTSIMFTDTKCTNRRDNSQALVFVYLIKCLLVLRCVYPRTLVNSGVPLNS